MRTLTEIKEEIKQLESESFMYYCNDQYDKVDEISEKLESLRQELEETEHSFWLMGAL